VRKNLVIDAGFDHGFISTSMRWEGFAAISSVSFISIPEIESKRKSRSDLSEAGGRCAFDLTEGRILDLTIDRCWPIELGMVKHIK
jgi:hypothetical protein